MKLFKTFLHVLAGGALLLALVAALTQTRFFKNWLRDRIMSYGREAIDGALHIGRIDGNALTRFVFNEVLIAQGADTVIHVPRLRVALQPLGLLNRELRLSSAALEMPRLFVRQLADGSLNVAHLLRSDPESQPEATSTTWAIYLEGISLTNARISFTGLDSLKQSVPRLIEVNHARVHGSFVENRLLLNVDDLRLNTFMPSLEVSNLRAEIAASGDSMRLENFSLQTAHSKLHGDIAIQSLTTADFTMEMNIAPLLLDEFHRFFPVLKATGVVNGRLRASRSLEATRVDANLQYGESSAKVAAILDESDSSYALEGVVRQLDLAAFGIDSARHSSVNARFTAEGRGFDWPRAAIRGIVWLDTSRVAGFQLPRCEIEGGLDAGNVQARANYFSEMGSATAAFDVRDLFGAQNHVFRAALKDFDLTRFYRSLRLEKSKGGARQPLQIENQQANHVRLSLTCSGSGRSFDPKKMELTARLHATASQLGATTVDSLLASVRVRNQKMEIDSLRWHSPTGSLYANGVLDFALKSDVQFRGELGDLELIRSLVEADSLRAGGSFFGNVAGPADSLVVTANFALHNVQWNNAAMQSVNGTMNYRSDLKGGTATLDAGDLLLGIVLLDTANALIQYDLRRVDFQSSFARGAQQHGEIDGRYTFGDTARLDIHRADIFVLGQAWKKSEAPTRLDIGDEIYDLHNVMFACGEQRIFAEGRLDYRGEEDLRIGAENVSIANVAAFLGRANDFEGVLDASARFFGTASAPLLQGKFALRDGRLSEFRFPSAQGSLGYADERFFWDVELQQNVNHSLIGEGFLPINLALNNEDDVLYPDRPMRVQFNTSGLELSFLQALFPKVKSLNGMLAFNISAENTPSHLQPAGFLRIDNAGFSIPKYGIQYRDIELSALIDTSFIHLQKFKISSGDGAMTAEGRMEFTREAISGIEASLRAKNFLVMHNRDADLRINSEVRVGGTIEQAGFAGDLTVTRSRFFLPALQPTTVMQVDERLQKKAAADCTGVAVNRLDRLLQNSYGELRVIIPRNTWLRGPELNVEIEGELDLVIDGDSFLLFGPIAVVRGTYELYGNKFTIDQGSLTFQGNKENLPEINLEASRVFRNAITKDKQVIRVAITGRTDAPKIAFQLDDADLEEKDALSYLLFGVSFDELTLGQKPGVAEQADKPFTSTAASGLLTGLVSKQISNALAKSLNLDVIEFQSGEDLNLEKSRVLVGKYITNDLFLSYSRDFSSADAQKVSLEYEIARFLFLQAAKSNEKDTGFDLIWKWEW